MGLLHVIDIDISRSGIGGKWRHIHGMLNFTEASEWVGEVAQTPAKVQVDLTLFEWA